MRLHWGMNARPMPMATALYVVACQRVDPNIDRYWFDARTYTFAMASIIWTSNVMIAKSIRSKSFGQGIDIRRDVNVFIASEATPCSSGKGANM
jgi:hypothetical protein